MQHETPQSVCRFGVAHGDITPPVGIYHRMWGAATHDQAVGVHRPLVASTAIFQCESDTTGDCRVLITLDHCLLGEAEMELLKSTIAEISGVRQAQLMVTFTHTHGAGLMSLDRANLPGGDLIAPYLREVAQRCGHLVAQAQQQLAEAIITYGHGRCSLAANRDFFDTERQQYVCGFNPGAPADDTVVVARVTNTAGQVLATFINYACHPTTLAWENQLISPDFIGALRETVEQATSNAPCIFLQGASAELGPREGFVGDVAVADRNGRQLAYAALEVLTALPPAGTSYVYQGPTISGATLGTWKDLPWTSARRTQASALRWQATKLDLAYRQDRPSRDEVEAKLEQLQQRELEALAAGEQAEARDVHALIERQTRMLRRLDELPPDAYPYQIQAWRMGDAIWLGVRGELYSGLQTSLRTKFPRTPLVVMTLVDGWGPSYIVPQEKYGLGLYQESVAVLAPGTFEQVVSAATQLITELLTHQPS
ncbi:neutral/alkaline non-lysosomal ceramidase N-terminal domain-containing protein [Anatilimnocola sp. NA78]|uniref:neutral/alkaline non-lysosomal ceramidase N-terminal domain-containing protein n=1 Tax=Anatilimnocola sp. NA78 TaxID=3415683 RepID=UPI003CE48176